MMLGLIEAEPPSTTEHSGLPIDHFFEQKLQKVMASSLVKGNQQLRAYIKKWTDPGKAKRKVYPLNESFQSRLIFKDILFNITLLKLK